MKLLCSLVLAACLFQPAAAAPMRIRASQPMEAAKAAAMASLVRKTINQWGPEKVASQVPAIGALVQLDLSQSHNLKRFELLLSLMEPLKQGQELTPESFAALTPAQQEMVVRKAAEKASLMANAKAGELIKNFGAEKIPDEGLAKAKDEAEGILLESTPYLSGRNRSALEAILTQLKRMADRRARRRITEGLEQTRRGLEQGPHDDEGMEPFPDPEGEAGVSGYSGQESWLEQPEISLRLYQPRLDLPSFQGESFDLREAREDRSALEAVKERFEPLLEKAGSQGDAKEFWRAAGRAFEALQDEILKDGLAYIRGRPLGPWARAKLDSYKLQNSDLWFWIRDIKERQEMPEEKKSRLRLYSSHVNKHNQVNRMIEDVEAAGNKEQERGLQKAVEAAKAVSRLRDSLDGSIARPLFTLLDYRKDQARLAESNPDPNHLETVKAAARGGSEGIPSLRKIFQAWKSSLPGNLPALKRQAVLGVALTLFSLASLLIGWRFYPSLSAPLTAASLAALVLSLAKLILAHGRANRFRDLGTEINSLAARLFSEPK